MLLRRALLILRAARETRSGETTSRAFFGYLRGQSTYISPRGDHRARARHASPKLFYARISPLLLVIALSSELLLVACHARLNQISSHILRPLTLFVCHNQSLVR